MPTDVHAHYVPPSLIETIEARAKDFDLSVIQHPPACSCALHFNYGLKVRPFFPKLIEPVERRIEAMQQQGVDHQVLSMWTDIFAPGLPRDKSVKWHRYMNEHMAALCNKHPDKFSLLASVPFPHAQESAAELEYAMKELGAVGAVVAANVDGVNLGELDLDAFWQTAVDLDAGVFIHPVQAQPNPRSAKFALSQIAQYTVDTTFTVGSLISTGVLDRFPALRLLLSHGGGTFPYLTGRFDIMHERMDSKQQGDVAQNPPSSYLRRFYYDTILHDPTILKWLASRVSADRIALGSDYSFPPADIDPVATVHKAGFSVAETNAILEENAKVLFPQLPTARKRKPAAA
ncbi:MAG: amidohydrolase family protein [Pseudolabrys sp.]